MKSYIPRQVITMVATVFSGRFSHGDLNRIFYQAGADWKISDDTKYRKIEDWLHDCNKILLFFLLLYKIEIKVHKKNKSIPLPTYEMDIFQAFFLSFCVLRQKLKNQIS